MHTGSIPVGPTTQQQQQRSSVRERYETAQPIRPPRRLQTLVQRSVAHAAAGGHRGHHHVRSSADPVGHTLETLQIGQL